MIILYSIKYNNMSSLLTLHIPIYYKVDHLNGVKRIEDKS